MSTGAQILIVDDDPHICHLLTESCRRSGHNVASCSSAEHALDELEHSEFDIVFSDVQLPLMQGNELIRHLKSSAPDTEVIGMSGASSLEAAVDCMRNGAMDFLSKPFDLQQVQTLISRAMEQRALRRTSTLFHACQRVIAARADQQKLSREATTVAMSLIACEASTLYLPRQDGQLRMAHSIGAQDLQPGPSVLARVVQRRAPEASIEPGAQGAHDRCLIIYPMFLNDHLLGVLCLGRTRNPTPFQHSDLERLGIFATQLALSLENTHLLNRMLVSERLASVGQVATGVAHEIKQPIAWLSSNLGHLESGLGHLSQNNHSSSMSFPWSLGGGERLLVDMRDSLSEALEGLERINEIVADINTIGRTSHTTLFNVNDTVRSAIRITRSTLRSANVTLVDVLTGAPQIRGAPGRLSQVFVNLLVNAAQAIAEHREPGGCVTVRSHEVQGMVVIDVMDDGPGLSPAVLHRLFDRFFTTKPVGEGTGLGLCICREIVEEFGGTLTAGNAPNQGAVFSVRLPIVVTGLVTDEEDALCDDTVNQGAQEFTQPSPPADGRPTVQGYPPTMDTERPPPLSTEPQPSLGLSEETVAEPGGDIFGDEGTDNYSRALLRAEPTEPLDGELATGALIRRCKD
ncbi:MAG: response regulator [Bradymonadia bacterium]